jgi:periplasmic copper chaperone A
VTGLLARSVTVTTMTGAVVLALVLVLPAAPASAHVTVHSVDAEPGGSATIAFRVPNESETARTSRVHVQLPLEHPFEFVSVRQRGGWTHEVKLVDAQLPAVHDENGAGHGHAGDTNGARAAKVVSEVVWTVTDPGAGIPPGNYDEFEIRVRPLPDVDDLTFKAVQTYDDGRVDRWIEPADGAGAHPAPVLGLRHSVVPQAQAEQAPAGQAPAEIRTQLWTMWLAVIALVIASGALAVTVRAALASRGARRRVP